MRIAAALMLALAGLGAVPPPAAAQPTLGICGRTAQVRDAVVAMVDGVDACESVTAAHLAGLRGALDLSGAGLAGLRRGDFHGLSALSGLDLGGVFAAGSGASFPAGAFDDLRALRTLDLSGNELGAVAPGAFANLASLETLDLADNRLARLPGGVFDALVSLETLDLGANPHLTDLPDGVFEQLVALRDLTLPDGDYRPRADAGPDRWVAPAAAVTLDASGSRNGPWGSNVVWAWTQTGETPATVTLSDADTAQVSFTAPAPDAFPLEFTVTVTGRGVPGARTTDTVTVSRQGVCGRTPAVRDAIVAVVPGVTACAQVSDAHLAAVRALDVSAEGLVALHAGDFARLAGLGSLDLSLNRIASLPEGVFAGLGRLTSLHLDGNALATLPAGVFDGLAELRRLDLGTNALTALPDGVFADLAKLHALNLQGNPITAVVRADAGANFATRLNRTATLDGRGSSAAPWGENLMWSWVQTAGPAIELRGASIPTPNFVVPLTLQHEDVLEFTLTVSVAGGLSATDTVRVTVREPGVCGRTPAVRDAILAKIRGVDRCGEATSAHLAAVRGVLDLESQGLTRLKGDDFAGLSSLNAILLDLNALTHLPVGVFDGLGSLRAITLTRQRGSRGFGGLTALPEGVFDDLSSLRVLTLGGHAIARFHPGTFDDLADLRYLNLNDNREAGAPELPPRLFENLARLEFLGLRHSYAARVYAGADQHVDDGDSVTLAGTVADAGPWGDNVAYEWVQTAGPAVALAGADTARASFTVPAGVVDVALEFSLTVHGIRRSWAWNSGFGDLNGERIEDFEGGFTVNATPQRGTDTVRVTVGDPSGGVCARSPAVRAALLAAARKTVEARLAAEGRSDETHLLPRTCADVTGAHLASLTGTLDLSDSGLLTLRAIDFTGLSRLTGLDLAGNALTWLPAGVFAELVTLRTLDLADNALARLPDEVFHGLVSLTTLDLARNALTEVPAGKQDGFGKFLTEPAFHGLASLATLDLSGNALTGLPPSLFARQGRLESLDLSANRLRAGGLARFVFRPLVSLTHLDLSANPGTGGIRPDAHAGHDRFVAGGERVTLDGYSQARDLIWGDNVAYAWTWTGGEEVAITHADTPFPRITAPPEGLSTTLTLAMTGAGGITATDTVTVAAGTGEGICGRSIRAQAAILARLDGVDDCASASAVHRAAIGGTLTLADHPGTGWIPPGLRASLADRDLGRETGFDLRAGDFAGLTRLETLVLGKQEKTIPAGVFDGLFSLRTLTMNSLDAETLPGGVFDDLAALQTLNMSGSYLRTLPGGVFDTLRSLETLDLGNGAFSSLPYGVFANLRALATLTIDEVHLSGYTLAHRVGGAGAAPVATGVGGAGAVPGGTGVGGAGAAPVGTGVGGAGAAPVGTGVGGAGAAPVGTGVGGAGAAPVGTGVGGAGVAPVGTGVGGAGAASVGTGVGIGMRMVATGVRGEVLAPSRPGGLAVAVKSDVLWLRTSADAVRRRRGRLEGGDADIARVRLAVEGAREFALDAGTLRPALELGLRHDGGDAETGAGLEVGGGLRWAGDGITVEGSARLLAAHEARGYEEWGVSGSVRVEPGESGRGLTLRIEPVWGEASSGVARLWSVRDAGALARGGGFEPGQRLDAEVGYGLRGPLRAGVMTPFAGVSLSDGGRRSWRLGSRWRPLPAVRLGVEATRTETPSAATPEQALVLRLELSF